MFRHIAARGHDFHRVNIVAAAKHGKDGAKKIAPECYQDSMKADRFEKWFEFVLMKNINAGMTVIMTTPVFIEKATRRDSW